MSDVLSVGVIGAGTIAHGHMRAIQANDNIRLVGVMDVDAGRAEAAAGEYGGKAYTTLEAVLEDPEVEGVHVCTPHYLHADQVVASAEAGKHVLVEKPMALTVPDCDRMVDACERAGKVLMVGQVMRHSPVNRKVRDLIAEGAIGKVGHLMRRRYGYFNTLQSDSRYGAWYMDLEKAGICVLYGFGTHEYDILQWYVDSPIVRVYAQGSESTALYRGQKDTYSAVMNHVNGAVSVLTQSVVCHTGGSDQHIIGSEGSMLVTGGRLRMNGKEVPVEGESRSGFQNQIGEFAACCLEGREPDANGRSVRHTMAVIEAAKQSAERDEPVPVSEFDRG